MSPEVCAGIVTYNCEMDRISENLEALRRQVSQVFVVDNGSRNVAALAELLRRYPRTVMIPNQSNRGIAAALNQLCGVAERDGFESILLLDQDSVSSPRMVQTLWKWKSETVGIVAPQIIDRNKCPQSNLGNLHGDGRTYPVMMAARKGIITSGSLVNIAAFRAVGGFDESFFIDYVDYDFNKRLMLGGYSLIRTGETYLTHECGHFKKTPFFFPRRDQEGRWKIERFYSFGHSSGRCYYKARNRILYSRKYRRTGGKFEFAGVWQLPFVIVATVLVEDNRWAKLRAFGKGIVDGLRLPIEGVAS